MPVSFIIGSFNYLLAADPTILESRLFAAATIAGNATSRAGRLIRCICEHTDIIVMSCQVCKVRCGGGLWTCSPARGSAMTAPMPFLNRDG